MNREDIIQLFIKEHEGVKVIDWKTLEELSNLIAAYEQKQCEKVVDELTNRSLHAQLNAIPSSKAIELLKRCHDLLRRVDTVTPEGRTSPDGDRLAKEINDYLNHVLPTEIHLGQRP